MSNYISNLVQLIDLSNLQSIIIRVVAVLLCLSVHETCHGLAAYALGDPTAKQQHRLSLNPIRHIDPIGLIMMFIAGFGWAKPVPVDMRYFKNPKSGMAITALAGPVSNILLAFILLIPSGWMMDHAAATTLNIVIFRFLYSCAYLSVGLGVFNLIPIPPLDGSKILAVVLPDSAYMTLMRYEQYGFIIILAIAFLGVGQGFLAYAIQAVFNWLSALAGF